MNKLILNCFLILLCQTSFASASVDYKNRSISINCAPELQPLLMDIQKIPEAKELLLTVYRQGPICIEAKNPPAVSQQFGACWDAELRVIFIDASAHRSKGELIGSIIFELHNAAATSKLEYYDHLAASGKIDKESYVRAIERIEFENSHKASKLAEKGIQMGVFPVEARLHTYQNFEEHYHYQKVGGHSSWIARNYDSIRSYAL
jgi:hypothetical protein